MYTHRHLFCQLGTLKISKHGFIYWENAQGRVSLQQFWDNILVASTYPDSPDTTPIHTVRDILLLCECATADSDACRFLCHNRFT